MINDQALARKADILKALAHPTRLAIVQLLAGGERCVCEIQSALGITQSSLSQHLALLREQGIVDSRKEGTRVVYWLCYPQVVQLVAAAGDILAHRLLERGR